MPWPDGLINPVARVLLVGSRDRRSPLSRLEAHATDLLPLIYAELQARWALNDPSGHAAGEVAGGPARRRVQRFGTKAARCFVNSELAPLLPHLPSRFLALEQRWSRRDSMPQPSALYTRGVGSRRSPRVMWEAERVTPSGGSSILYDAAASREDVLGSLRAVGIHQFELSDLEPHRRLLHECGYVASAQWRALFWHAVRTQAERADLANGSSGQIALQAFGEWAVVQVLTAGGPSLVLLSQISRSCYCIDGIPTDWAEDFSVMLVIAARFDPPATPALPTHEAPVTARYHVSEG